MKKLALAIICVFCIASCTETKKNTSEKIKGSLAQSFGKINELSVIIDNELWTGSLGDTIRKYFGAEVPGLPQEEPVFSMRQLPTEAFTGLSRRNRTFLKIQEGEESKVYVANNKYATPQLGYVITGTSQDEIMRLIQERSADMIKKYKKLEMREKQSRIKKSVEYIPQLKEKMGITLKIPSAYRIANEEDKFFWLRKDITNGDMNLMIYELPMGSIPKDSNTIAKIIKVRDSVGMLKIPTNSGKFITEEAYAPYLYETKLDDKFAFETKGTWEIKDRYMAGPFVNYVIDDVANDRQLVIEGFVLAPSVRKRNFMFELEAIIKSIKFE
ncbi:protein of unknown function [Aquimarina amphilecti]|uniref:DUF4837 domain-containing protein n=1 Tax=Aquimarina amphilecti TaxID=1038014 RepID=A0A1H7JV04_AQUAM|nr:DUF4837 family protein [Aquimarina amphilecti]SEK78372.1 protein of unknown function [Aquimarina amphilecti]